jgi:transposase
LTLLTQGAAAHGWHGQVWTTKRVAALIASHFGVHYHPAHVSRLLRRLGWSVQKPIVRATQRDAQAVERWQTERWPAIKKKPRVKAGRSSG